mmetsp:Transcript_37356/g.111584  ORF Transcript_37356/g.111584 Transcript_37356/m.111584 type:complete len:266 (-) Transcript_37356:269-1066(-)
MVRRGNAVDTALQLLQAALPVFAIDAVLQASNQLVLRLDLCAQRLVVLLLSLELGAHLIGLLEQLRHLLRQVLHLGLYDDQPGTCVDIRERVLGVGGAAERRAVVFNLQKAGVHVHEVGVQVLMILAPFVHELLQTQKALVVALKDLLVCSLRHAEGGGELLVGGLHARQLAADLLLQLVTPLPVPGVHLVHAPDLRLALLRQGFEVAVDLRDAAVHLRLQELHGADLGVQAREGRVPRALPMLLHPHDLAVEALLEHLHLPAHR